MPIAESSSELKSLISTAPTYRCAASSISRKPASVSVAVSSDSATPVGGLKLKSSLRSPKVPAASPAAALLQFELEPDVVDRGKQRAELQAESRANRYVDLGRIGDSLGRDEEPVHRDRAELNMRRQLGLEPRLAVDT